MDTVNSRTWIDASAEPLAAHAERDLAALVDVSSPSGDVEAAESVVAVATALLPDGVETERLECSSPDHAPDLLAHMRGTGERRLLLLGHLDTVIPHAAHHPLRREGELLRGPGTIDMKGGVALSIGVLRALTERREDFDEVALLLVVDEEWRSVPFVHAERFTDFDACLCFEGGELTEDGDDAVVVNRKAAGTIRVAATGRAAHSGSEPEEGRNALLALARVAQILAGHDAPEGPNRLTVVPTILSSGDAFNIVPGDGELFADVRAASLGAIEAVMDDLPDEIDGVELNAEMTRRWPAMQMAERAAAPLALASELLGRPIVGAERGGASDASHLAAGAPLLAIDGLGPLGGGSHAPDEHVVAESLRTRAEVALALVASVLSGAAA
ncbi:MAG TPA: M20/M25/M40 family metallo-hydrolase [Solirubrobacterales bacterium]|nr:M20/M25/M40 family metallo-hydrolase [Solirubrobacterales bacterium]